MYNWFTMLPGWRVVKLGGNTNNSANTEAFNMNANNTSSNVNRNISVQLALNSKRKHRNHASWQNKLHSLIGVGRST
jgi:FtsZ-binding cell division protein ZapB